MTNSDDAWIDAEARERVEAIESPGYDFGPRFSSVGWLVSAGVILSCLIAIFAL